MAARPLAGPCAGFGRRRERCHPLLPYGNPLLYSKRRDVSPPHRSTVRPPPLLGGLALRGPSREPRNRPGSLLASVRVATRLGGRSRSIIRATENAGEGYP